MGSTGRGCNITSVLKRKFQQKSEKHNQRKEVEEVGQAHFGLSWTALFILWLIYIYRQPFQHLEYMFSNDTTILILWNRGIIILKDHEFYDRLGKVDIKLLIQQLHTYMINSVHKLYDRKILISIFMIKKNQNKNVKFTFHFKSKIKNHWKFVVICTFMYNCNT